MNILADIQVAEKEAEKIERSAQEEARDIINRARQDAEQALNNFSATLNQKYEEALSEQKKTLAILYNKIIQKSEHEIDALTTKAEKNKKQAVRFIVSALFTDNNNKH